MSLSGLLERFAADKRFKGKGPLSVALVVTQHARRGLPLESEELLTKAGGQVLGLGRAAVQDVLARHGITQTLAAEGGRTSRGSIQRMREYVAFLNGLERPVDLDLVEGFWIERVREFFAGHPFRIRLDSSQALRMIVRELLAQAEKRQRRTSGMQYAGAVLQHLVGAKLDCALGSKLQHNSFSTSDEQTGRAGDFLLGDVAIHVTTAPSEALIDRCRENLDENLKPVLITTQRGTALAQGLAENKGMGNRVDVFEAEQFVALNLYELGRFAAEGRKAALLRLLERYNEIVDDVETDPSLKIKVGR